MWKKIDQLSEAIGVGKNWIIGIMVTACLNLIGVIATLMMIVIHAPN